MHGYKLGDEKMNRIEREVRDRAEFMRKYAEYWEQGEPAQSGGFCAMFNNSDGQVEQMLSVQVVAAIERWLPGYVREYYPDWAGDDTYQLTGFNDDIAGTAEEVATMFEKFAAQLD